MRRISARISSRSLASRFDSGSSMSTSGGATTTARGDRDALLLAAGDLAGQAPGLRLEPDEADRVGDALRDLGLRAALHAQAEADVAGHVHVREQGVVLEHHAEAAVLRAEAVDAGLVEPDGAGGERQQAREAVERGGLAAAGRAEEGHELAAGDGEVDPLQRVEGAEVAAHAAQVQGAEVGLGGHVSRPGAGLPFPLRERVGVRGATPDLGVPPLPRPLPQGER